MNTQLVINRLEGRLFELGNIYITPGALADIPSEETLHALKRHASGDWGTVCKIDQQENDFALTRHLRIFSAYRSQAGIKFWIITEADRSATTILKPNEY